MSNAHNPQHWSQLDMDEQIRFWQGVEDGHVASFLVSPEKKSTRRRRGEHSTKPKCENPTVSTGALQKTGWPAGARL
ncbi:hypothetical protein [Klebsiella pneumoniae]|uniref:hypothetical protein n=1 Tax=Klebsiella pneumoniae TaxID=573 RepID=UPI00222867FD|nr:hypothetical protein [Klebsiella pneumoniae]